MNNLKKTITAPRVFALIVSAAACFFPAVYIYHTSQHNKITATIAQSLTAGFVLALLALGAAFAARGLWLRRLSARLRRPARAEEVDKRLLAVFGALQDGVFISNSRYRIEYANSAARAMFGSAGDRPCYDYCSGLAHACPWCERGTGMPEKTGRHDYYHERLGRYYEITVSPIENADDNISIIHIFRDITASKYFDQALQESEDKFRSCIEESLDGILLCDSDGKVVVWNRELERMTQLSRQEMIGRYIWDVNYAFMSEESKREIPFGKHKAEVQSVFTTGRNPWGEHPFEMCIQRSNGASIYIENVLFPIKTKNAYMWGGICRDITHRRNIEEALRVSENKYRELVEYANSIILRMDIQGTIIFFNAFAQQFFGYEEAEIIGRNVVGTIVPQRESTGRDLQQMILDIGRDPDRFRNNENENMRKNGDRVWICWSNKALCDQAGNIREILCIGNDITERRKAQVALKESEGRLRSSQKLAHLGDWEFNVATGEIYWSDELYRLLGYEPGEIAPSLKIWLKSIHPHDRRIMLQAANYRRREPRQDEYRMISKNGSLRYIYSEIWMDVDAERGPMLARGILQDITLRKMIERELGRHRDQLDDLVRERTAKLEEEMRERRKKEEELRVSEARFRGLVANIPGVVYRAACVKERPPSDWILEYVSPVFADITGQPTAHVVGKSLGDCMSLVYSGDAETVARMFAEDIAGNRQHALEFRIVTYDGSIRWVMSRAQVLSDEMGNPLWLDGLVLDITARKQAELALRQSEERFRSIAESAPDAITVTDEDLHFIYWNDAAERIFGYTSREVLGKSHALFIPAELQEHAADSIAAFKVTGEMPFGTHAYQTAAQRKDGAIIQIAMSVAQWEVDGRTYYGAITRDVTERVRMQAALQQSEAQFRAFAETSPDAVIMADMDMNIMYWNTAAGRIYGYSSQEMLGRTPECLIGSGVRPHREEELNELRETGSRPFESGFIESMGCRKDGTEFPCEVAVFQWEIEGRMYFGVILRDITQRKLAEEALRQSEARFRAFAATSPDAVIMADMQMNILYWNAAAERIFGYSRQEMLGRQPDCLMGNGVRQRQVAAVDELNKTGTTPFLDGFTESTGRRKNGTEFPCEIALFQWEAAGQFMVGVILRDITQRKAAAGALRRSQERYRGMLNAITTYTYSVEVEGKSDLSVRHSQGCFAVTGYHPEDYAANPLLWHTMIHCDDRDAVDRAIAALHEGLSVAPLEHRIIKRDGATAWVRNTLVPYRDEGGRLLRYDGIIENITQRKLAEEALRASEEKLDGILSAVTEYMVMLDEELTIVWANDQVVKTFGGGIVGRKCHEAYVDSAAPCQECAALRCFATGRPAEQELAISAPDGSRLNVWCTASVAARSEDGAPRHLIYIAHDITERKKMQAEALRAAHLASIGELAAGVAHEINNPINGIINCADILKHQCQKRNEDPDVPVRIIREGERVAAIVRNLLTFARERKSKKAPQSISAIYDDAIALLSKQFEKNFILIRALFPGDLPQVIVQPQQIQQVFMNLLSNARYALNKKYPDKHGDKLLEITAQAVSVDGQPFVRVVFHDRGIGASKDDLERLCNPFFTTKPPGEGTGLGLSISYNIIKDHGGALAFESAEGDYMRVTVDLPAEK